MRGSEGGVGVGDSFPGKFKLNSYSKITKKASDYNGNMYY